MLPYIIFAAFFFFVAAVAPQRKPNAIAWATAWVLLVLFVGLRHKVGMDWNNYLVMSRHMWAGSLQDALRYSEPAYAVLLWSSVQLGLGVYGANLVGTAVFALGLFRYARTTPQPWLALAVAVPILVVVVAMSADRQAIAIGILLWLAAGWEGYSLPRRIGLIVVASMFHYSAIFFLLFGVLGLPLSPAYRRSLAALLAVGLMAFLELSGSGGYYDRLYVTGRGPATHAEGATQHVLLNGIPALLLFAPRRIRRVAFPTQILRHMAWLALLLVPTAFLLSGAASRMTLYLFPVSMHAFAALPGVFPDRVLRAFSRATIAATQLAVLLVWLNFANSRIAHIPYRNALFMSRGELHIDNGPTKESQRLQRRKANRSGSARS